MQMEYICIRACYMPTRRKSHWSEGDEATKEEVLLPDLKNPGEFIVSPYFRHVHEKLTLEQRLQQMLYEPNPRGRLRKYAIMHYKQELDKRLTTPKGMIKAILKLDEAQKAKSGDADD